MGKPMSGQPPHVLKPEMKGDFTQLPNAVFRDSGLSHAAIVLLLHLAAQPPGYVPQVEEMDGALQVSRNTGTKIRQELAAAGYARFVRGTKANGTFEGQWFFALWPKFKDPNAAPVVPTEKADTTETRLKHAFAKIGVTDWADIIGYRDAVLRPAYAKEYRNKVGSEYRFGETGPKIKKLNELLTYMVGDYVSDGVWLQYSERQTPGSDLQTFIQNRTAKIFAFGKLKEAGHYELAYITTVYNEAKATAPKRPTNTTGRSVAATNAR